MIVRGSLERLTPVLMTALVTAFALAPLLFEAEQPGTEILHPVAVVIFSGLISATLLDTFITPRCSGCSVASRPNACSARISTKHFDF
jgi:heavy-metal exporter, HME family